MKEYPKIETLFERDEKFKVITNKWRLPEFEYLAQNTWQWTEKVDGTNVRIDWNKDTQTVTFGGRTDNAQIPIFLMTKLQELFPKEKFTKFYSDISICLYGEGFGAKIQKGGGNYISNGVNCILFDILIDNWWLKRPNTEDIATKLEVEVVPIIGMGPISEAVALTKNGFDSKWGKFPAEGIVLRPLVSLFTRRGDRVIGKIKTKDF